MTHIDEEELRRGLRELAEADGTIGAAPPTGAVVARGRRTRHRRRAAAGAACAAVLAAGAGLAGLRTGGHAPSPDSVAAVTGGPADRSDPPLRFGPVEAEVGVAYAYDLVGSCRYRYALFDDRKWVSEGLRGSLADSGGRGDRTYGSAPSDRLSGRMTLTSRDTAVFETGQGASALRAVFRPASDGDAPCPGLPAPYPEKPPAEVAEEGVWYPHSLFTHCGLRYTTFDGRTWRTVRDHQPDIDADRTGRWFGGGSGFARMAGDTLRFETAGLPRIDFVPAAPGEEPPGCA
ncbi:hypothetical protein LUX12_09755 [Streptomyces somaliensis]|uniref:hypothetical protein n=1 Tax=Streptomyces somaliensis TaxID=78355 RepID=UPI0020CE16A6|nr:hypothetical protein [Streptomyces somaliensis]MCP9945003.1 hypothetical protein [Streptomyces somaliensis]MCP9961773.1 hypothetical protein [Streptomyces somaliensis]MCP9974592.1 hypothetical protein [Streptomyces somaliensis]